MYNIRSARSAESDYTAYGDGDLAILPLRRYDDTHFRGRRDDDDDESREEDNDAAGGRRPDAIAKRLHSTDCARRACVCVCKSPPLPTPLPSFSIIIKR